MNRQGILDSSEPECSHEGYIAEKHVYCPDCGDAGAEMLLQERIAELEAENQRLRDALEIIAGKRQCVNNLMGNVEIAMAALLGGGENG